MKNEIIIKGARENNLKDIDLSIPKNSLVVFTGLSGSGKTTLAFDTIFAEGQRRYVESLSSYARQFLGNLEKPDVDSIEGLSPAIAIDQKGSSHNPRSTVGTVTEIYDYFRLLFARIGVPYCPIHKEPIISYSVSNMCDFVLSYPLGSKIQLLSPIVRNQKGTHKDVLEKIKKNGFERLRVDSNFVNINDIECLDKNKRHNIDIIIDRLFIKENIKSRVFDSIETCLDWSNGYLLILLNNEEKLLSQHHSCPICGFSVPKLEPRLFSFNAPLGYCPDCKGLGIKREVDINQLIPDFSKSISEGGIRYFKNTINTTNIETQDFNVLLEYYHIDKNTPLKNLTKEQIDIILNGSKEEIAYRIKSSSGQIFNRKRIIEGVKTRIERLYLTTTSEMNRMYYESFMMDTECKTCHGSRLNPQALAVYIDGKNIFDVCQLPISDLYNWLVGLKTKLNSYELDVAKLVLNELEARTSFLVNVGLDYLSLSRMASTLSGGEAQRIRLATQIGSKLSGVLYVLDEPSIGLHQKDDQKLISALKSMRDLGNTLIVVEHDEETILESDYLVDIGPGAGVHGGKIVFSGKVEDIKDCKESITGQYLSGEKFIPIPNKRRLGNGNFIEIKGARCHNLKNIDVKIPLGKLVLVTGVSGSGKSSLINDTLLNYVKKNLYNSRVQVGEVDEIIGLENIDKVIEVSQEPIGRTPRSNPATYTRVFDEIRNLFAETPMAKAKGYDKSRFSFNVSGGRCEHCLGDGVKRIPMNFLPDVYVKCPVCEGKRYNEETLSVTYKGKNIYEVLEMTVDEALVFFENRKKIYNGIKTLSDVGLGYIKLGQNATTLSGGEAQRIKLANELQKKSTGKTLYILDEPTTGLHTDDISRLLKVLERIVDNGDSVIVIEHNLDVIKVSDYIIDIGPDGGDKGGRVVGVGTPEQISQNPLSYTGEFLKDVLKNGKRS